LTASRWQESAGSLLLLAAAQETGLIEVLLGAVPEGPTANRLGRSQAQSRQQLLLTVLFLSAVGLARPWDLRGYSGDGLALLSGRSVAYGYVHVERFLSQVGQAGGDQTLTVALAGWVEDLWPHQAETIYYVDMHRKPVHSAYHLPRGRIGRSGKILACRGVALLNDEQGHPLMALTMRGDTHLTQALRPLVEGYQEAIEGPTIKHLVVDREGLGAEFLAGLKDDYQVVTLLKSNQYQGLASFTEVGQFEPLGYDRQGKLITEVALAEFALTLPDQPEPDQVLPLYVALVRDQRRQVPVSPAEADDEPAVSVLEGQAWWQPDWEATPLPAAPTEAKLIPIVSTHPIDEAAALSQTYKGRWPAQENIIRDFLIPLGGETNHGYAKTAVENSEVSKRLADLTRQRNNVQRWRLNALERSRRASKLYHRRWDKAKAHSKRLYDQLNQAQFDLQAQQPPDPLAQRQLKEQKALIDAQLALLWQKAHRAIHNSNHEWRKAHTYAQKERQLLRQIEDLQTEARQMYQLDDRKDQLMTSLRLALTNLIMWTRDQFFPPSYAQATWKRLAPFFRLPGHLVDEPDRLLVYLRPFNDRQLNRDLAALCEKVNALNPCLPDGRSLRFLAYQSLSVISDMPP